ncbi:MAG: tRNA (guanine37-N1)-methyltransferase [Candidatus Deianiraeaceae bacterium]|jgi:tRNA (guanine37-N1)-methyltransferase
MNFTVLTLYPEAFPGTLGLSIAGRSIGSKWNLDIVNLRDYGLGKHKQVDDAVYGGGSGMLMRPDVIGHALEDCLRDKTPPLILLTSPSGITFNQKIATSISNSKRDIIIICGRFEGVDCRVVEYFNILQVSIGNFVVFGGEVVAMCIMESIIRLQDGVCGNGESITEESFAVGTEFENLMEYPQYTRPHMWNGIKVPSILRSGHHAQIKQWRLEEAQNVTKFSVKQQSKINTCKF